MKLKKKIILSLVLFSLGLMALILSIAGITGAFIGVSSTNLNSYSILGFMSIFISIILLASDQNSNEKKDFKEVSFEDYLKQLEINENKEIDTELAKKGYNIISVRVYTYLGQVPLEDALRIHDDLNEKVDSGEWVELFRSKPTYATGNRIYYKNGNPESEPILGFADQQGICVYRYFGPKDLQGKITSGSSADKCVSLGEIAKLHEIVNSSETKYNDLPESELDNRFETRMYKKENNKWRKKTAEDGKDFLGLLPNPSENYTLGESFPGAKPLHRHWELKQIYQAELKKDEDKSNN